MAAFYGRTLLSDAIVLFLISGVERGFHGNDLLTVIASGTEKFDGIL